MRPSRQRRSQSSRPGITSGAAVRAPAVTSGAAIRGATASGATAARSAAAANMAAGARTAFRPNISANTGATAGARTASNFRTNWNNLTPAQRQAFRTTFGSAVNARAAANTANAANTSRSNNWLQANPASLAPGQSGAQVRNNFLLGNGYYYGGNPYFGGGFFNGRNLIGMGLMSALGGGYGGYGLGGYGLGGYGGYGLGGYGASAAVRRPRQLVGLFAVDSAISPMATGMAIPAGTRLPATTAGIRRTTMTMAQRQRRLSGQPGSGERSAGGHAGRLCSVGGRSGDGDAEEEMKAPHDWMPLGTFSVATSQNDTNPIRVAQLAYDNKQGLISGTIFNRESNNLYTIAGQGRSADAARRVHDRQRPEHRDGDGAVQPDAERDAGAGALRSRADGDYLFARLPEPPADAAQAPVPRLPLRRRLARRQPKICAGKRFISFAVALAIRRGFGVFRGPFYFRGSSLAACRDCPPGRQPAH